MTAHPSLDLAHQVVLGCAFAVDRDRAAIRACVAKLDATTRDRIRMVAVVHGLQFSVAWCLSDADADMPKSASRNLDEPISVVRANEGRERLLTGELLQICEVLNRAGISAFPFKGPALQQALDSAAGLREITDLDLLVREEQLISATRALIPLGYEPVLPVHVLDYSHVERITPEWQLLRRKDELLIELHCCLAPSWFPAPCSLNEIECRQQTLALAGHSIAWPAPEELLLVHIADGMKSCGRGMKWIGDIARILRRYPEIDWTHIGAVASRHGGLNIVRVALALVSDCCAEVAASLDTPRIGLSVAPQAEALADDARHTRRLATAVKQIRSGIQRDAPLPGAMAHFRWSIRVSDRPLQTAAAVARYLTGPAIADLAQVPSAGNVLPLPARAFMRRLRAVVGFRH